MAASKGTWDWEGGTLLHFSVDGVRRASLRRVPMGGTISGWALYTADGMQVRDSAANHPLCWAAKQTAQRMAEAWAAKQAAAVPVCP